MVGCEIKARHAAAERKYRSTLRGHLLQVFQNMRKRCYNPKSNRYHCYGGRGIEVCFEREEFVDYVMNELQIDPRGLTIDRIDNDGNYERGNIRFTSNWLNCQNRDSCGHNTRKK